MSSPEHKQNIRKVIKDSKAGMLVTLDDGIPHACPMHPLTWVKVKRSPADFLLMPCTVLALVGLLMVMASSGSWAVEKTQDGGSSSQDNCELTDRKREMLSRINEARSEARNCGDQRFEAVKPLSWNCKLEVAAELHSQDMAENDYFSHTGPDGVGIQERVNNTGYVWRAVGENIAAGQESIATVIEGWLGSPGHCSNIMNDAFTEMGMAKAKPDDSGSETVYRSYWTQVLAQPR